MTTAPKLDPALTRPEVSNRIAQGLVAFFEEQKGAAWIDARIEEAGLTRAYLEDASGWSSTEFAWRLSQAIAAALHPDDAPWPYDHPVWNLYREAGHAAMTRKYLGGQFYVVRTLPGPLALIQALPTQVRLLQKGVEVQVLELGSKTAVVRARAKVEHGFPGAACWNMRGSLEAAPGIWGLSPAQVQVEQCMHRDPSVDACIYRISVEKRPGAAWRGLVAAPLLVGAAAGGVALALAGTPWMVALSAGFGATAALSGALAWHLRRTQQELRLEAAEMEKSLHKEEAQAEDLWNRATELQRSLETSNKLSDYLPDDLVEEVLKNPAHDMRYGGRITEAAVLFADLVGFTPRCERKPPEAVVEELNLYFNYVDQAFVKHGGVIDKRMGDGVMAVFVPRDGVDHLEVRRRAVRCGLDLLRQVEACNEELGRRGVSPLAARVGVAAGKLVQGTMGSSARLEYTVIGDVVNLAARLEGEATPGHVLVTSSAWKAFDGTPPAGCLVVGRSITYVKGVSDPVDVIELAPEPVPPEGG